MVGSFFIATTVALAAVAFVAPVMGQAVLCQSSFNSPLLEDCKKAAANLPRPANGMIYACPPVYASQWALRTSGTCTIEAYSSHGNAACLHPDEVRKAVDKVLSQCVLDDRVEGGAETTKPANPSIKIPAFEGVRFIRSSSSTTIYPRAEVEKRQAKGKAFKA